MNNIVDGGFLVGWEVSHERGRCQGLRGWCLAGTSMNGLKSSKAGL